MPYQLTVSEMGVRCGNIADLTICNFADVGINFRNLDITPTRLETFLQTGATHVRRKPYLTCSFRVTPSSFSSGFCTTILTSIQCSFILGQSLWFDF